jgi:hypothetical protein
LSEGDKESLKEKDVTDDDASVGKFPAITQAKKRRTINEDMDADNDKVIPSNYKDNKFVDFVELKDPATIIPLLEQELVLPSDEVQNRKKPTLYQQIQQRPNVHKTAPKKKTDRIPTVRPNALKNKEWHKIENSWEIFPMWVDPPEIYGTEYKDMFEPEPAEEYNLTDVPLHQQTKAAARQM